MGEPDESQAPRGWSREEDDIRRAQRSLADAVQLVRTRRADRDDVVIDMKEAERARIDLLVEELRPLFEDVDPQDERFDFAVSSGRRPRLWLDATTYVSMGNDRRTYRLVRDRLHGRSVLAETGQLDLMADAVSTYIAERVLERRRALEGEWEELFERDEGAALPTLPAPHAVPYAAPQATYGPQPAAGPAAPPYAAPHAAPIGPPAPAEPKRHWAVRFLFGALQFVVGLALVAAIVLALLYFFPDAFPD